MVDKNPCQIRGASVERAPERPIASMAEVDALVELMPSHLRIAVVLAAWCQLRRGEVRGLRRMDVNLEHGLVSIDVTRTTAMSGRTIVKEPKTRAGKRTVAIPPNALEVVTGHLDTHVGADQSSLVVSGSDRSLSVAWTAARATIGRNDLRFHDLRHSGLTWSAATGGKRGRTDEACRPRFPGGSAPVPARDRRTGSSTGSSTGRTGRTGRSCVMYTYIMQRTQISLTAEERRALDAVAARTGRSISALIRDAVEIVYGTERSTEDDLAAMRRAFGSWTGRTTDGAEWVEERRSGARVQRQDS